MQGSDRFWLLLLQASCNLGCDRVGVLEAEGHSPFRSLLCPRPFESGDKGVGRCARQSVVMQNHTFNQMQVILSSIIT